MFGNSSKLILFCLMFAFVAVFMGCTSESKTLKLTPSKLDFGSVNIGDTFSIDVVLKNKYGKAMVISNITITGSSDYLITAGGTLPINLDNNAEHTLKITFTPSVDGAAVALMSFVHDASTKAKEVDLEGIGVAVPRIDVPVTSHDFGIRLFNTTIDQTFDIENVGTADMTISAYTFTGTGAATYSVTVGGTIPTIITHGATHTITVQFAPTTADTFLADLEIMHDAVNATPPAIISLTGEGVLTAPKIEVNRRSPWDFGTVAKTMPSTQTLEISSIGSDPLTIASITFLTGAEFTLVKVEDANGNAVTLPETVAVSSKIVAFIKFAPTANTTYNDTLTVMHNGLYNPAPLNIALTGEGRDEISRTFTYTGSAQQWTVPAGVGGIVVECYGAEGGSNYGRTPGKGGKAVATVPVTPGDTINVYVGGKGGGTGSGVGGWNGGGAGGGYNNYTAGGGGASDIRIGGAALTDRKVVGGAGGGAAWDTRAGRPIGGAGGGLTGGNGTAGYNPGPGLGGTQTAGGAGGRTATPGTLGVGGRGVGTSLGGAGGGGGYYGGGGGYCSGGGGGSSYYDAAGNTDKSTTLGVRSGNGEVIIKY